MEVVEATWRTLLVRSPHSLFEMDCRKKGGPPHLVQKYLDCSWASRRVPRVTERGTEWERSRLEAVCEELSTLCRSHFVVTAG